MTNTDYITINENGVFVGGKPATKYRSVNIFNIPSVIKYFQEAKKKIKDERGLDLLELHVLSSETSGTYAEPGNPSPKHGRYAWCRAKLSDGTELPWVFYYDYALADFSVNYCAYNCAFSVATSPVFRGSVFRSAGVSDSRETQPEKSPAQQTVNTFVPKPGDVIEQSFGNQTEKSSVQQTANPQSPKQGDVIEMTFGNQIMKLKVLEITQKQRQ